METSFIGQRDSTQGKPFGFGPAQSIMMSLNIQVHRNCAGSGDINLCPDCFNTVNMKLLDALSPLTPIYDWNSLDVHKSNIICVICKRSFVSKADMAILNVSSGLSLEDIARMCKYFMWYDSRDKFLTELLIGGYTRKEAEIIADILEIFSTQENGHNEENEHNEVNDVSIVTSQTVNISGLIHDRNPLIFDNVSYEADVRLFDGYLSRFGLKCPFCLTISQDEGISQCCPILGLSNKYFDIQKLDEDAAAHMIAGSTFRFFNVNSCLIVAVIEVLTPDGTTGLGDWSKL